MDLIKTTKELAEVLSQNNLGSINLKSGEIEITLEAKCDAPTSTTHNYYTSTISATESVAVAPAPESAPVDVQTSTPVEKSGNCIKSPIVGTFYSRPAPDKPPFVNIGDKVTKGQTVCIVESMKLMNEITSEFDGTVSGILALDGEAVDFDKELIRIE